MYNWKEAYFEQAKSDCEMYRFLNKNKRPLCHRLHYLQMATEKLAKSYLCSSKGNPPKTHYAFVYFLKFTKKRPDIREQFGYGNNYNAYASYIDSLINLAEKIEKLAPIGGNFDRINPEYPWKDNISGEIICPCTYYFSDFSRDELSKIQMLLSKFLV